MEYSKLFDCFPTIRIDDISLRQISYRDQEDYFAYLRNPEVNRYIPDECIPHSIEQTKAEIDYLLDLFRYKRSIYWAVALSKNNRLIGSCGFNYWNQHHSRAEISYDLCHHYWGKGIMSRVLDEVLTFAFDKMELKRIEATVTPSNAASLRVLEKKGFQKEGILRQQKLLHGDYCDAVMLSLLNHEYQGTEYV